MADSTVVRSDVYVYVLYREDGTTPFYVGLGIGSRLHGIPSAVRAKMVANRIANGTYKHSPETIAALRVASTGRKKSPEEIEKRRRSMAGFKHSPETVAKMRERRHSDAEKNAIRLVVKAAWDGNTRRRISQSEMAKAAWKDPEKRAKNIAGLKQSWERRKKLSHDQ